MRAVEATHEGINPIDAVTVIEALNHPQSLAYLSESGWGHLIRHARRSAVLARLACRLQELNMLDRVPPAPRAHLIAEATLAKAQERDVRREVSYIAQALEPLSVQVILLKGAAYVYTRSRAALGRLFADIDVLVPRDRLAEVEAALLARGWITTHPDPYDQHYYRAWMHELAPMENIHRNTVVDIHHAILPRTARLQPDTTRLWTSSEPLADAPMSLRVLCAHDRILHSIVHLFHNEDVSHGLRDLSDLDAMIREEQSTSTSIDELWAALNARARELNAGATFDVARHCLHGVFATPGAVDKTSATSASVAMGLKVALWKRALLASSVSHTPPAATRLAIAWVFARAHIMRMPWPLLLKHASIKGWRAITEVSRAKTAP